MPDALQGARRRVIAGVVALALGGALVMAGCAPLWGSQSTAPAGAGHAVSQAIIEENAQPGNAGWAIPRASLSLTSIQAYANTLDADPGGAITFYVSTRSDALTYRASLYRLGWYGGKGGRLYARLGPYTGQAQGYYDEQNHRLIACGSCLVDAHSGAVEARWRPSFTLPVSAHWLSGVYDMVLTASDGKRAAVTFDVRAAAGQASTYLAVTADTTAAAYNSWGGWSLYVGPNGDTASHGSRVSLDRPLVPLGPFDFDMGLPFEQGLPYEIDAIRWMEREGYDVSYASSLTLHETPDELSRHAVYISLGHDEYWSKEMRDGVERARDRGVSLLFLGANDAYWQIRFEPDSAGVADRTIVCYHLASRDPLAGYDDARVTVRFRDAPVNRPENALLGVMLPPTGAAHVHPPGGFAWVPASSAGAAPLASARLTANRPYGCDLVGYEWDQVVDNGQTPGGLRVIAASPVTDIQGNSQVADTTYYTAPSGALVFAAGSIQWSYALDSLRLVPNPACHPSSDTAPGIQALLRRVMDAAAKHTAL